MSHVLTSIFLCVNFVERFLLLKDFIYKCKKDGHPIFEDLLCCPSFVVSVKFDINDMI